MDRKRLTAFAAMAVAGITLVVDGIVTMTGRSGASYHAYRIFVTASGPGTNQLVGRTEIIAGAIVIILSVGLWRDHRWGWIVGVIFGCVALGGLGDAAAADRVVGICGLSILAAALMRIRESRQATLRSD